jgi:two-component system C4-dicarboxylate transport response regulator DctD
MEHRLPADPEARMTETADTIDMVAFVDDDDMLRTANLQTLAIAGLRGQPFAAAEAAIAAIDRDFPGIVVTDVRMPGMDGLQLFRRLREADPELPVILITGHADVPMAVAALKDGAWDFLTKPFGSEELIASVRRALETRRLVLENRRLRAAAVESGKEILIGRSPAMERLRETVGQLARADVDVMIEGEAGTGKELVAVLLHRGSDRRAHPFVTLNCAALPEALAESEIFGHQAGAVPGAHLSRKGQVVGAHRGTLFLEDLDSMVEPLQIRMLRVLEEHEVVPIGGDAPIEVDVRVIAAVNENPARLIADGRLREDLYYRLNVVRLRVPPLRERPEDISLLFAHFVQEAADRQGIEPRSVTDAVLRHLHGHDWPGNVRELRHFAGSFALGLDPARAVEPLDGLRSLPERIQIFEAAAIRHALTQSEGDIQKTLERLRVPRKTLYDKLSRYQITPSAFRRGKP